MLTPVEQIETYQQAEQWLLDTPKFTSKNPMEKTKGFYQYVNRKYFKQKQLEEKIIHIAGTNGKGSVCAYLNAVFQENDLKIGMFTSPHLISMCERFQINGTQITEKDFLEAFLWVQKEINMYRMAEQCEYRPTFFEFLFFMSLYIFDNENVDIILMETGLGGKLDATNATETKALTIITEIGLDHTQFLGNTIEKIAGEKAGILRAEVPVVYTAYKEQKKAAADTIEQKANQLGCKAYCLTEQMIKIENIKEKCIDFSMKTRYYGYIRFTLSTTALYQVENAALAVLAIEAMQNVWKKQKRNINIAEKTLQTGIRKMKWVGRMEEILPNVFVDGGHNPDGIKAFMQTVKSRQKYKNVNDKNILLFSAVSDKAYEEMIQLITEDNLFDEIYVTRIKGNREIPAEALGKIFDHKTQQNVKIFEDVRTAWERVLITKKESDIVYVAGSLYLVGLIKQYLQADNPPT